MHCGLTKRLGRGARSANAPRDPKLDVVTTCYGSQANPETANWIDSASRAIARDDLVVEWRRQPLATTTACKPWRVNDDVVAIPRIAQRMVVPRCSTTPPATARASPAGSGPQPVVQQPAPCDSGQ
jgi:hypothetical protein